ncbi:MAG: hypothetical protein ABFR82_11595 [Nitrospirota bacterium]
MLTFQNPPDKIFTAMLTRSIELTVDQLRELIDRRQDKGSRENELEYLMPFAFRVFTPETALETFQRILVCHKNPDLYRLNNYHYLLLYDILCNYSEIHNDMVRTADDISEKKEASDIGGFQVERIDFGDLISMYFHDTDFLFDADTVIKLGLDKRKVLGMKEEIFGISQGLAPHPEELRVKLDESEIPEIEFQLPVWGPDSKVYPDFNPSKDVETY